jgi:hypothetical protein
MRKISAALTIVAMMLTAAAPTFAADRNALGGGGGRAGPVSRAAPAHVSAPHGVSHDRRDDRRGHGLSLHL